MMENRLRPRAETLVPLGIAIFGGNKFSVIICVDVSSFLVSLVEI